MVEGAEKREEAGVGVEESESKSFSSSTERRALSLGKGRVCPSMVLRDSLAADGALAAASMREVTDDLARCEAARRDVLTSLPRRVVLDMGSMPLLN